MNWSTIYNKLFFAKSQDEVIDLIKTAAVQQMRYRSSVEDSNARQSTYNLLVQTLRAVKRNALPQLHLEHTILAAGLARLKAPIPPRPSQLLEFDSLWCQLRDLKQKKPVALVEVSNPLSDLENKCFSEAEGLLLRFKVLCDPLNPQLTEADIASFWED